MTNNLRTILLPTLAVILTTVVVWYQHLSGQPRMASWNETLREAQKGGYQIIGTEQLWDLFRNQPDQILVVDVRQKWEYRTGYIKNAINFPMEPSWWARLTKRSDLRALLGPDINRKIIFY